MQNSTTQLPTPSIQRRLMCLVYEAFLVGAVSIFGVTIFTFAAAPFHSQSLTDYGSKAALFLVIGAYLIHSWMGSGFTLAMKTWRIKVVILGQTKVPFKNAAIRYLVAWFWVLPAFAAVHYHQLKGWSAAGLVVLGAVGWAMTALFDKDRQFLHDRLAGTRLISLPKPEKKSKDAASA